jgi:transcriptional regulator with XRE-family HTH domain
MQLGKRIRDLRFRRGLTVQQLAEASGLSKGFISQVENDRTSPSLATLRDLARALQTSIAFLVVEDDHKPHLVRERERPRFHFGGGNGDGGGASVEILSAQPKRNLEMLLAHLPVGASTKGERPYQQGEVCLLCVEGRVRFSTGDHAVELEAGDSCHYDGRAPHTLENCGSVPARILIASTLASLEPSVTVLEPAHTNGSEVPVDTLD